MTTGTFVQEVAPDKPRKVAAGLIWLIGLWTTEAFIRQIGFADSTWLIAICVQAGLTGAQSAFWNHRATILAAIAVTIDTLINFGGLYPYLFNIPGTDTYLQLQRAFPLLVPATPPVWLIGVIALIICAAIAGLPELIWRGR
jgi:hypothetical protein